MKPEILFTAGVMLLAAFPVSASGPLGIYGIVEKVVFEPDEASAERIQVWGAFSYVEGPMPDGLLVVSRAQRGYLYFKLRSGAPGMPSESEVAIIRNEWLDLKSVAGTGQPVGFGRWPGGVRENPPSVILGPALRGTERDFRVRPAGEAPTSPAVYHTNAGIVKLSGQGGHEWIVNQLRDALKR
jgi:hypothetical protein